MAIDYETIGKFACEKAKDYERAIQTHTELVRKRNEVDAKIDEANKKGDKELLAQLYKEFRIIKQDQMSNLSFRQKFCDDFLYEISQMMKEY